MRHRTLLLVALASAACGAPRPVDLATAPLRFPFQVDTQRAEVVAPGVVHRFIYSSTGPWAIHVLDVNRDSCYSAVAVKGFPGAIGRKKTSAMLAELDSTGTVIGGVNGDFFSPNGLPTNAHISRGRVITGPNDRPVLAFDSTGTSHILKLRSEVRLLGTDTVPVASWNRHGFIMTFLDSNWGAATDTASFAYELVFARNGDTLRLVAVDTSAAGVAIPSGGGVLFMRRHDSVLSLRRDAERITPAVLDARLHPFHPVEAVGGRPILARDSAVVPDVDSEGAASFARSRHPRTGVGIASGGRRLLFVAVDGRQQAYSDGMTLRELANLMLALGARDAINLDGGGSTAMVVKSPTTRILSVVNKPSDPTGERAVGNALAIVKGCARRTIR